MDSLEMYPQPDFARYRWLNLNGVWKFAFDDKGIGIKERWYMGLEESAGEALKRIRVPYSYESLCSFVDKELFDNENHELMWYEREVEIHNSDLSKGHVLLHFGAVDYSCRIWINGIYIGEHIGGSTHFYYEVENALHDGQNRLTVMARDSYDAEQLRGKQCWSPKLTRCWYTPTSGIWRNVWLEFTGERYITRLHVITDIDQGTATVLMRINKDIDQKERGLDAEYIIRRNNDVVSQGNMSVLTNNMQVTVKIEPDDYIDNTHLWSPEHPTLYVIELLLIQRGQELDRVSSYFGMRRVESYNGHILLNHEEIYQRLVLDQGYWPDGIMTPPNKNSFHKDLLAAKQMGFNGVRMHQKFEDPQFYYEAAKLGMLVWGECPSAYVASDVSFENILREWTEFINERFNDPAIIVWVPLNESWGMRDIFDNALQQQRAKAIFNLTKALDPTRLISTNDGWETIADSDIIGIHDYEDNPETLTERYKDINNFFNIGIGYKQPICKGNSYKNQPFLITEYGGISLQDSNKNNWGYHEKVNGTDEYLKIMKSLTSAIQKIPYCCGFCYTQLTDVMQETNGLLTAERENKADIAELNSIFSAKLNPVKP